MNLGRGTSAQAGEQRKHSGGGSRFTMSSRAVVAFLAMRSSRSDASRCNLGHRIRANNATNESHVAERTGEGGPREPGGRANGDPASGKPRTKFTRA